MAYEGPEYWYVIYKAIGDFGQLMKDAAAAKSALQDMASAVKAESAAEVAGANAAATARQKDTVSIQQEAQALSQLANAAKQTNVQLLYGGRNDMTQHLSDMAQELQYTTLLNRQKWLGFSSVQQAMSYRQQMYQLALLENRAHFAGYLTADQYLGFLQRETANVAALSAAIRTRTGAISAETSALLAHTNALEGTRQTFGQLGEQLGGSGGYSAALQSLPPVVTTRAFLDTSQAIAALAAYHQQLAALPRSEVTNVFAAVTPLSGLPVDVPGLGAAPGFGGRVPVPFGASGPSAGAAGALLQYRANLAAATSAQEMADAIVTYHQAKAALQETATATAALSDSVRELSPGMAVSADIISRWSDHARLAAVDVLALEQGIGRLDAAVQMLGRTKGQVAGGQLMDLISLLEGGNISNAPHGYPVAAPLQLTGADQVTDQIREIAREAEDAGDEFSYLDEMLAQFGSKRVTPQVDDTQIAGAEAEAAMLAAEMAELDRHAQAQLGVDFAQVEAARISAEALAEEMAALDHEPVEIDVELNDAGALAELDVLQGRVLTAEEQGKALMSLLGQGGAGGGGGGGGPPPGAGTPGGENPDDAAARALLAEIDALFQKAGNDAADMGVKATKASKDTAAAVTSMIAPVTGAAAGWFGLLTQVNLWGGLLPGVLGHTTALHFVLDGIIETLAILIPAIVTLAAGLTAFGIAGSDAAVQVYNRFNAIHTVMDATGATIPPMTRNLENLHNVVRPQVWQLYGDAITLANNKAGIFNQLAIQTGSVVDHLAARLTVDLTSGGQGLKTFFSVGAENLAKLGIIFDNLGKALLALIKVTQDTHVDQIFLNLFVALSQLLVLITKLPTPLLAVVVGLHAFWLWGGLAASIVLQLLNPLRSLALALGAVDAAEVAGGLSSLTKDASAWQKLQAGLTDIAAGFGALPARLGLVSKAAGETATAVEGVGTATEDTAAIAANAAGGAGGIGALLSKLNIFKGASADATVAAEGTTAAVGEVGATAGETAAAGGGLLSMLGALGPALANPYVDAALLAAALAGVATYLALMPDATQRWTASLDQGLQKASAFTVVEQTMQDLAAVTVQLGVAQKTGAGNATELAQSQQQLSGYLGTELTHVGQVAHAYGTDLAGALALLNTAGVKTSDIFSAQGTTWAADLQQVKGLVAGYAAMGQGLSALQQDVSVQLVDTSSQVTAMGKLNQAWDTWTTTVAGAPSAFLAMDKGFQQFTTDAKAAGASMTGLNAPSLTLQSDFQSNYDNVQKFFDAFRNDQALTGQGDFTQFVKDAVASLIPMAGGSKEAAAQISALAQEAGGPATTNIKTLQQWVGNIKDPLLSMYDASNKAAEGASSLSQDAARLTTTLQQQLNPAMATAVFNARGGQLLFNSFAQSLAKLGPSSQQTIGLAQDVAIQLEAITGNSQEAKAQFVGFTEALGLNAKQSDALWTQATQHMSSHLKDLGTSLSQIRKQEAATVPAPQLGTPGEWGQIEHFFMAFWDGIYDWFKNSLPHAFELAWDSVFDWFSTSVPHGLAVGWDAVLRAFKAGWKGVEDWFTQSVPHAFDLAWAHVWSAVLDPVKHAFGDVTAWVAANFDPWWATHGSAVEKIWAKTWNGMRSSAVQIWHNILADARDFWSLLTFVFTGGKGWDALWKSFEDSGRQAWQWAKVSFDATWGWMKSTAGASWRAVWQGLRESGAQAWQWMKVSADFAWANMKAAGVQTWQVISLGAKVVGDALALAFKGAWATVVALAKITWDTIVLIVNEALDIVTGHWHQAWTDLESYGKQVFNALAQFFETTAKAMAAFGLQMWHSWLDPAWQTFYNLVVAPMSNFFTKTLVNWFVGFGDAWQQHWVQGWQAFYNNIGAPMANFFTKTLPGWWDSLVKTVDSAWNSVWSGFNSYVVNPLVNFFTSTLPNVIRGAISQALNDMTGPVSSFFSSIRSIGHSLGIPGMASGGAVAARMSSGSVPGTGDEDGTHIVAMGGEFMLRKSARMALQARYGPDILNWLNHADTWLGSGSRGNMASQRLAVPGRYASGGDTDRDRDYWRWREWRHAHDQDQPVPVPPPVGSPPPNPAGPPPAPAAPYPVRIGVGSAPAPTSGGPFAVNLAPYLLGTPQPAYGRTGSYGFAAGGEVMPSPASLSHVAAMFGTGMAAGGLIPNLFIPGLSATLARQLQAAGADEMPRTLSAAAAASRVGLHVDNLTINNPRPEKPSDTITRSTNRLAFLAGRGTI